MEVIILAGGFGTRIVEESQFKPKPMIEINGKPIIWYIMKHFSNYGFNDFIICAGYKQEYIKKWFYDYFTSIQDICFDHRDGNCKISYLNEPVEKWRVKIIDTGIASNTGERIRRIKHLVKDDNFFITYGDCISNINLDNIVQKHKNSNDILTISTVKYPSSKGVVIENEGEIIEFREKDPKDAVLINAGFMVANKNIFNYIGNNNLSLEKDVFTTLLKNQKLGCCNSDCYWACVDSMNDKLKIVNDIKNGLLDEIINFKDNK